jgi:hypothetical protein
MKEAYNWHHTKLGLITFFVVEAALLYIFASLSITTGNLLLYLVTILLFIGALQNLVKFIGKIVRPYA